jgi:spore coat polysaccharide biosynthesis predicted glycosyltransferase SpsG
METLKVKVYLRTFGNDEYGMGHVYRSLTLAKKLRKQALYEVFFIIRNNEGFLNDLVTEHEFITIMSEDIEPNYSDSNVLIYDMPFLEKSLVGVASPFDYIVALDYFYQEQVSRSINLITHYKSQDYPFDVKEGIEYTILNDSILSIERNSHSCKQNVDKILISFGSLDPKNNTLKVLNLFSYFCGEITIVIGALYQHSADIEAFMAKYTSLNITLVYNPNGIGKFINQADIVICGGGTTVAEVIYIAKPALVYPQTKAEAVFVKSLKAKGLCLVNEKYLPDFEKRERLRQNCLKIPLGKGCSLIIDNIKEVLNA